MNDKTDSELMEQIKSSDFGAFDELFSRYSGRVRSFLLNLTWEPDLVEDWVQEVFYRLWKARERYQPVSKFSTYILQIAKNLYISALRKSKAAPTDSLSDETRDGYRPFANIRANARMEPEVHLLEEYRRYRIRQAIKALPEAQRLVFVMAHLEDIPYAEIAEILNTPIGTVKSRMHAAVQTLWRTLEEQDNEL